MSPERVVVSSASPRGLFYGAVTLWQLASGKSQIPALEIEDAPRLRWRGLMLDSARHYQSQQFIERLIDTMALHKLNVLHWHLTDDQAWRIEIKKYPKLTEVGAWRVPAGPAAAADIDPATGKPRVYGGFYTQDQVREIVAYAAARHVTIVPEIEMPGHASAAIAAYPQLGVSGKPAAVSRGLGHLPEPVQRRGVDVRVSRGRARRSHRAVPGPVHPCRRRRGSQGSVAGVGARAEHGGASSG